ncbi:hypothetical protein NEIMUCOT_05548 [Neisseria mucosa ATCC 25996]|uniref:Uncharacterized protein n=1 Tax=Neisseria mucosa (strain ATCC 25996 / DSM 4631 / NCTC 10774 / M26) TaxID=546266 RepID=D2ZY41_NEIM2|nr:hypothetical protein NEIMUCOT_05548 [Neisseria mucosa ATCC 25996]
MVDVPSLGTVFQTTLIGALAVFGLLNQLSGGIVAVGGDFAVPADQYEIVKEQMIQTTSKKIVKSSEKQKPRACVPHTPFVCSNQRTIATKQASRLGTHPCMFKSAYYSNQTGQSPRNAP